MTMDLTRMKTGYTGVIKEINGGPGCVKRLHSMGLRPGKKITKISSHFWRGPQTVKVGHFQIAVGFGMAKKIIVQVEK